jgi:1-acyl-sn-glycerol-3-phosphate acyltransferase
VIQGVSPDLPHTDQLPVVREYGLRLAKPLVAAILRTWWRVRVYGSANIPKTGPVILAANHLALLDGPVLIALTRRLTFAMAKHELFEGLGGRLLSHVGQISLNRHQVDTKAINRAVQVLRAHQVLAVFPEGVRSGGEVAWAKGGAAYLALIVGAPIVPVAILGTRQPGQTRSQLPRRRAPIHLVYGEPFQIPRSPWPRGKALVGEWTEVVRTRLADHVVAAQALTGLPLPGPPKPKPARNP